MTKLERCVTGPARVELFGVPVDCVTMDDALAFADRWISESATDCAVVLAVNPEKVMRARTDAGLRRTLNVATLLIPDGIGVVWAVRWLRLGQMTRVPGSEFMPKLCALAAKRDYGVFLYGARPEVNEAAAEVLLRRHAGLRIVGRQHGYMPNGEMPDLIRRINDSGAEILFVALGSPRQEAWILRNRDALDVKVCQGVGGTFDVIAGRVERAPPLFLRFNLEWLYRLLREPRRLFRQTALVAFAARVVAEKVISLARRR
jgi:N-acetylglucosaminyldiphosphoundecaprenol N-acetyl-beta-D-mannosaminyltransferase